jgi:hypothetical protein
VDDGMLIGCATLQGERRYAREQELAQTPEPPRAPVDKRIGHTMVHADNWDIYNEAYQAAMRKFDEWRDGATADQLEMLNDCIDANKHCMGSGWLDVHQFLDWMCEHPGLVCPKERGSGLQDALSAAASSGMVFGGRDGSGVAGAPRRFITTGGGVTIDRLAVNTTISAQRQGRHVLGASQYTGGSYFNSADDAQRVLDAFHGGTAEVLGVKGNDIVVRVPGVTGYNVNPGAG